MKNPSLFIASMLIGLRIFSQDEDLSYVNIKFIEDNVIELNCGELTSTSFAVYRIKKITNGDTLFVKFRTSILFQKNRLRRHTNRFEISDNINVLVIAQETWMRFGKQNFKKKK